MMHYSMPLLCLKLTEKIPNTYALINSMNDDFGIVFQLFFFISNIKMEVCGVLDSFLSF
jgi:hypothetical protein